jgi:citronellol/citronellal dehydrogenase
MKTRATMNFNEGTMTYRSVFKPGLFAGRTVIVTGGGSGIGRCTAHELAALGASVALVGRNPEKLEKVREEIIHDGGTASGHVCDIRDEAGRYIDRRSRIGGAWPD